MTLPKLFTLEYKLILAANFLLYFGFWLVIPVVPFYLSEFFQASSTTIGVVLSCYTLAALCTRPFSGYLVDTLARKSFYLVSYLIFTLLFGGYILASTLAIFILFRIFHGISFGMVTVSGNTVVIDVMPSPRRGEGLGYYGLANNIGMALGPMIGLFMHDSGISFHVICTSALLSCLLGTLAVVFVNSPYRPPVVREPLSLDRFFLLKGLPAGICLLLLSIPYGMTSNYVAVYVREIGLEVSSGFFFTFMAGGMAISRLFSGRWVDRGKLTQVIAIGLLMVVSGFYLLSSLPLLITYGRWACALLFFSIAAILGVGFGIIFPAYNTLFVNLAPNTQRGTATSTYLTSWDVGIGIGMILGGYLSEIHSYACAYFVGACLTVIATFYFNLKVSPHYHIHKLR